MGINFLKRSLLRLFVRSGMTPRLAVLSFFLPALFFLSCSRGSEDPGEELTAYCIRQCVIETSDAEICDTRCGCAVSKLTDRMSERDLRKLSDAIMKNDALDSRDSAEFRDALAACKEIK